MVASHGQGEQESEYGVVSGHAYSVISVRTVNHETEGEVRLVQCRNPWGHKEWNGDWSDTSELWTDDLKEEVGLKEDDDGIFYMKVEDFLEHFRSSSLCVENDLDKYQHNLAETDLANRSRGYYTFHLKEDIDCSKDVFAISCYQQGDRLKHYRSKEDDVVKNSSFNIILLKGSTWIKASCNGYPQFNNAVVLDKEVLEAGVYNVIVDPVWDAETTDKDPDYKKIVVDIYCSQPVDVRVGDAKMLNHAKKAILNKA